ncbi:MAG TPA: LPXTG cell wall anchor domain-containing protein, partial [Mycobacterium sp.]
SPSAPAAKAGSDTKASVLTAAGAGLALGGLIVFWQSRRHRRKNAAEHPGSEPGSSLRGQDTSPPSDRRD